MAKNTRYLGILGIVTTLGVLMLGSLQAAKAIAEDASSGQPEWRMAGFSTLFNEHCAVCHGETLTGAAQGPALVGKPLMQGDSLDQITQSIAEGVAAKGMPAWSGQLSAIQIRNLALYIAEQRAGFTYADFNISNALAISQDVIDSQYHSFQVETVVADLDPLPFSIAPLPDGRILLTEKMRGLSIISADGEQSPLIKGTPRVYSDTAAPDMELLNGLGWLFDVAIHPDYESNGWIYLSYGDRCSDCNALSRDMQLPVSMNKLIRGRIDDGRWVDEQLIWQADIEHYGVMPDTAAGGRISFDHQGHVFFSVGVKGYDNHHGIQALDKPWGKVHRVNDDGSIPRDNPFVTTPGALKSIWCYGLRSPQGLEFNTTTGELWGTDMGARGGDEVNRLLPGRNYGWPLYSKGVNYDSTPVEYGKILGIEFELSDIEQPVVDLTPSPAASSFIFYEGNVYPQWQQHLLVGSLKASTLYRMKVNSGILIETEVLIDKLARIRDIEIAADGTILLLLEHASGGQIVRLVRP